MDLIIGAPVHERAWVLPDWFEHLAKQELPWKWDGVEIVFNYGRSSDSTLEVIREARDWLPWTITVLEDPEDDHRADRSWSQPGRFETMARLRNDLLAHVREAKPTYYFSLDTDILLPEGTIMGLIRDLEIDDRFDAVAPTVYMSRQGKMYPNAMRLPSSKRYLLQHEFTQFVDVAFAAVMMLPSMYEFVDYVDHAKGEDVGWGLNAMKAGKRMGLNPTLVCKHVMTREMLTAVDPRIGW